jgi:hypothetical protein
MIHATVSDVQPSLHSNAEKAFPKKFLRIVPLSVDPILTPIPRGVCAKVLGVTPKQHDMLVVSGVLEQSCHVAPFGGRSLQYPLKMSNYWDLLKTDIALRFFSGDSVRKEFDYRLALVMDDVARAAEYMEENTSIVLDDLIIACRALEVQSNGSTLLAVFLIQDLPRRFSVLFPQISGEMAENG